MVPRSLPITCTAIVTVADDGGSSGEIRRDLGILPPGDIRNCLAALTLALVPRFGLMGAAYALLFAAAVQAAASYLVLNAAMRRLA